jgi:hypothetical protein
MKKNNDREKILAKYWSRRLRVFNCLLVVLLGPKVVGQSSLDMGLDRSTILEMGTAIRRGSEFLIAGQTANGSWSDSTVTTALCLSAVINYRDDKHHEYDRAVAKARDHLVSFLISKIPEKSSSTLKFTTLHAMSVALVPLVILDNPADFELTEKTRQLLKFSFLQAWKANQGSKQVKPFDIDLDLYQLHQILETLSYLESRKLLVLYKNSNSLSNTSVFWERLSNHLVRCQYGSENTKSDHQDLIGCFSGFPIGPHDSLTGNSRSNCSLLTPGIYTLSGLTTLLYIKRTVDDSTIRNARLWLNRNNFFREKPNCNCDGIYTCLYMLSKTNRQYDRLHNSLGGSDRGWQAGVVNKLLSSQLASGEWKGTAGDWGEHDVNLCTAYAVLSMLMCADQTW